MHFKVNKFIILLALLSGLNLNSIHAQDVRQMFCTMPDTIIPYIEKGMRQSMVEQLKTDSVATGNTLFNSKATLRSITDNHIKLLVDSTVTMDILMLPSQDNGPLCCIVRTLQIPQKDSEMTIYNSNWLNKHTVNNRQDAIGRFTAKPDTMSQEKYNEVRSHISYLTIEAVVVADQEIKLIPHPILMFKDDDEAIRAILIQKNIKWEGKVFK